ncbi:MAG: hypothetical protein J4G14_06055 [Dehalococcoidia bacterium]|nr:hypothetical protein [Dehalococcoidia bacterium]
MARLGEVEEEFTRRSLTIAVLGPNLENLDDTGTLKRYQIRDALLDMGHRAFFPEHHIDSTAPDWIGQEQDLLRDDTVDLVIILHTENSWGAFGEISNFVSILDIQMKTAVLFPIEHYKPTQGMTGNIVQGYFVRMPYTYEQMEICQLVSECTQWAQQRQIGIWPELPPHFRF